MYMTSLDCAAVEDAAHGELVIAGIDVAHDG